MGILNAHSINRKCIIAAGAAATGRAQGRGKEGRGTERGRERGRQPTTERNTLSPAERHAETRPTYGQTHGECSRVLDWGGEREKKIQE